MQAPAISADLINDKLRTLAAAIEIMESAIAATDAALDGHATADLAEAINKQMATAQRTLTLKDQVQQFVAVSTPAGSPAKLREMISVLPEASTLLPQLDQIEAKLSTLEQRLSQQAKVVNKMQSVNRQLLTALMPADNAGYDRSGSHRDDNDGRVFAQA